MDDDDDYNYDWYHTSQVWIEELVEAETRELSWVQAVSSGAAARQWRWSIVGASNRAEIGENEMRILIDSGSNENCVPLQFLPTLRATLYPSRRVLYDVQWLSRSTTSSCS